MMAFIEEDGEELGYVTMRRSYTHRPVLPDMYHLHRNGQAVDALNKKGQRFEQ